MEKSRKCPSCGNIVIYSSVYKKNRAEKNNSVCRECSNKSRSGENHPMFGEESPFKNKKHTEESKKLISENHIDVSGENNPMFGTIGGMYGKNHTSLSKNKISKGNMNKIVSKETRNKISESKIEYFKNNTGTTKGKKHNKETKRKMRLAAIKRIANDKFNGNQFYPSYNKSSIDVIKKYAMENNLKLKHAENGGEFYIKELGYWVDGYDVIKNVVVEFNEIHHKYIKEKDENRRNEIINFLGCEFIIIHEAGNIEKYK